MLKELSEAVHTYSPFHEGRLPVSKEYIRPPLGCIHFSVVIHHGIILWSCSQDLVGNEEAKLLMLDSALALFLENADAADAEPRWPTRSWDHLVASGGSAWCIPSSAGGQDLGSDDLFKHYEQLAATCLTTAFILSQRDAACRRIRDAVNQSVSQELLPMLAQGRRCQ